MMLVILGLLGLWSCQEWGEMDPPAGNQVFPKLVLKGDFRFSAEFPEEVTLGAFEGGVNPSIIVDDSLGYVAGLSTGYIKVDNPLFDASLQKGFSLTIWVKVSDTNPDDAALFSFSNDEGTTLYMTENGSLTYATSEGTTSNSISEDLFTANEWHYLAITIETDGYVVNVDGVEKLNVTSSGIDFQQVIDAVPSLRSFYLGYGSGIAPDAIWMDNIRVFRNLITADYIEIPEVINDAGIVLPTPVYYQNFEFGLTTETIMGTGAVVTDDSDDNPYFGKVYYNAGSPEIALQRTNYLQLPSDIFSKVTNSGSNEMTISFWVNNGEAASSSYYWSPLFAAYNAAPESGANYPPFFALQARLATMINTNGKDNVGDKWCDFTDAQNDAGENTVDVTWLDGDWHFYTAVWTTTTVSIYVDGVAKNTWTVDGSSAGNFISSPMTEGSLLQYICLGGNQGWTWGDPDVPYKFDDVAIYSEALSVTQIEQIISEKYTHPDVLPTPVYAQDFENGLTSEQIVGSGEIVADDSDDSQHFGQVFYNVGANGTEAQRSNYLLLPSNVFSNITNAQTNEMTISFWVNQGTADTGFNWYPMFSAYGAAPVDNSNTTPMMILQSRLVAQVNCPGGEWCDFTDSQNDEGVNYAVNDWLHDGAWHFYTAVWTSTTLTIYVDGVVRNSWTVDGVTTDGEYISGPLTQGNLLPYVCLGGNQAWNWGDNDPSYKFDDVAIYSVALSESQIADIMTAKYATE
ncbi:concanavalin A-like lectin/glucanase superfamily protein [Mangrovibacterium marinum]|uniref:Concanavalin A-like lectin/glucanase superfamily protein n=2 Tax=Mangrovibacterium marinum TaxID=1639118 RepID=A0A2T5BZE0_9BACT|nr:concanavalin A-like lectin/glucanase superfamily protein [Mangrovibacterium marinum]